MKADKVGPALSSLTIPKGDTLLVNVPLPNAGGGNRDALLFIYPRIEVPVTSQPPRSPLVERAPESPLGRFEFGAGYTFMQAEEEEVKSLNGFNTSAFYYLCPWVAVGGEFSGLYGCRSNNFFGGTEQVSLDRYLYLFGARVGCPLGKPVRLYGQVLVGGVYDCNGFSFAGTSSSSSANAFAMSFGGGVDFLVTHCFSLGPSFDYVPTNFSGGNGNNWQDNWRVNLTGRIHLGGKRNP